MDLHILDGRSCDRYVTLVDIFRLACLVNIFAKRMPVLKTVASKLVQQQKVTIANNVLNLFVFTLLHLSI